MVDYDQIAAEYSRHRRVHSEVLRGLAQSGHLNSASSVLEVGCGTGNYAAALVFAAGCACFGIDPSEEMLARARQQTTAVHFQPARAEEIPFPPETFDLVFSVDVIHHVRDRPAFFHDAYRVLKVGGQLCTVTDSEWIIRHRQPLAIYFPETIEVDLGRYPSIQDLRQWMEQVGFRQLAEVVVESSYVVTDIAPYRDKAYSCLHLIPADAFRRGIERMEEDLQRRPIQVVSRYLMLWGRKDR